MEVVKDHPLGILWASSGLDESRRDGIDNKPGGGNNPEGFLLLDD